MTSTTVGARRRSRRRITLLEILTTVTVSAVLVAAFVPPVTEYFSNDTAAAFEPEMQQLRHAVSGFAADVRHYPGDLQQLVSHIVSTNGNGDTLDFDGGETPVQFTSIEVARWRGPYTSAAISTGATGGGQFTSRGLLFTIGRRITVSAGWLTVPILSPTTCSAILALDGSIDYALRGRTNEALDGAVIWEGACSRSAINGRVANPLLRIARAN